MTRIFYLLFGVSAYFIFFASFLYLIAFVGDAPWVPFTINQGGADMGLLPAIVIDLGLVLLFGIQHSVMARPGFKQGWTKIVQPALERSIYVLVASLLLVLLFRFWVPISGTVWNVGYPAAATAILALFGFGWLTVLVSTFLLNHFELFGLKQVWDHAQGSPTAESAFRTPLLYKLVRHPIYSGFVLAFWAIPHMTVGHLLFAASMTIYILIAIGHEEKDLIAEFGNRYEDYRKRVGGLFPRLTR
jgi:protein-S-isoprenylcysteine O-methyltransferase Ste14